MAREWLWVMTEEKRPMRLVEGGEAVFIVPFPEGVIEASSTTLRSHTLMHKDALG